MAYKKKSKSKQKNSLIYAIIAIVVFILSALGLYQNPQILDGISGLFDTGGTTVSLDGVLSVHYIDIGQGDAELIVTPDGKAMLIDAGPNSNEKDLMSYLDSLKITVLEYAVFTHPHEDHIGGADAVFEKIDVKRVIMPDTVHNTATFEKMLEAIDKNDTEVIIPKSGDEFTLGEAKFKILGPNKSGYKSLNDWSIVLRLDYGQNSFMFTGDCEKLAEKEMLNVYSARDFSCDVLKIGHHGSSTSTSDEFLLACSPKYAVISCEKGNTYGHPHKETIDILTKHNIETLRTDLSGTIIFTSDGTSISHYYPDQAKA